MTSSPSRPTAAPTPHHPDIASALRTFEAQAGGIAALASALHDELETAFISAVKLMREARGRVIITGVGKSGHIARKVASTLA